MTWQVSYCLDFGFCFNYPKSYWRGYVDTLAGYGVNAVMLWVAGAMPTPGFEPTLAWRCDYVPGIVDYLHERGMRVYLMSGVYGWLGMSPGLLRMHPEIEIDWPKELKDAYPLESTRRGICPTRGREVCLDYVESLYAACPQADGMSLEVFCEKPHCRCPECTARGLWRIELEFLDEITRRLRRRNPAAEVIWNVGYERTHGTYPEAELYTAIARSRRPEWIWWNVRLDQGYTDAEGRRRAWADEGALAPFGRNLLCFVRDPRHAAIARRAGALGVVPADPAARYLFLPEVDPRHFGYLVEAPPPDRPLYEHVLFHIRAFRRQRQFADPAWSPDRFRDAVAARFFADGPDPFARAEDVLFLEDLILDRRVCLARSAGRVWGDIDGGERAKSATLLAQHRPRLERIASLQPSNRWLDDMVAAARALVRPISGS